MLVDSLCPGIVTCIQFHKIIESVQIPAVELVLGFLLFRDEAH